MAKQYYSTGITIEPLDSGRWRVSSTFVDSLFADQRSTEGEMHARYEVSDPVEAAKTLKEDMESIGIKFDIPNVDPTVYFPDDNPSFAEHADMVSKVCEALGWRNIYEAKT